MGEWANAATGAYRGPRRARGFGCGGMNTPQDRPTREILGKQPSAGVAAPARRPAHRWGAGPFESPFAC
ncbi:hypothetical protein [Burkholderia pseudomallei]|uniref:hypothetical protein n=1 Tax=Burkholderia pseudomallei TaxID=28450 RepID=UPI001063B6A7|nr:hypothetical protein E2R29_30505 [Burkholderia pseudomallei]